VVVVCIRVQFFLLIRPLECHIRNNIPRHSGMDKRLRLMDVQDGFWQEIRRELGLSDYVFSNIDTMSHSLPSKIQLVSCHTSKSFWLLIVAAGCLKNASPAHKPQSVRLGSLHFCI